MNYNCKYCDYVDKCSRKCEYNSILCKMNRSFPKVVKRPYKEILYENSELKLENTNLKQALNEIREYIYKNSIPINLLSNPPIPQLDFEGNINDILQIIDKVLGDEK